MSKNKKTKETPTQEEPKAEAPETVIRASKADVAERLHATLYHSSPFFHTLKVISTLIFFFVCAYFLILLIVKALEILFLLHIL